MNLTDRQKGRLLYISVMCEGPWERLATWLWAIDWRTANWQTAEMLHVVPDGSLRDRLATFCESRDLRWRRRYAVTNTFPPKRWRRRVRPCQPASAAPAAEASPE